MSKVALITGASRGIGKALCAHLALLDYDIVITSRSVQDRDVTPYPGTIMETAALVESLGAKALPVKCDVGVPEDVHNAVDKTLETFGRIDLMVNNARHEGTSMWGMFADQETKELQDSVNCNLLGPMIFSNLVIPHMVKQGGGMIINVSSGVLHSVRAMPPGNGATGLMYPATKTGLDALTYGLTPELSPLNIAVLGLTPGRILIERPTGGSADYFGTNLATRLTVHVPAVAVDFLVTCPDPMLFTGQIVNAPKLVREHALMSSEEISMPFEEGKIYDPYKEPFWERMLARHRS